MTIHRLRGSLQSLRSLLRLNVAKAVLEKQLREVLRFEKGGVYSVQVCGAAAHELCDSHETHVRCRQSSHVMVMASCGVTYRSGPPRRRCPLPSAVARRTPTHRCRAPCLSTSIATRRASLS